MQQKLQSDKTHLKDKPGALTSMSTLCNSGYVYVDSAQYQKAINVLEKALATQMAVLDKGNKLILNTLDNLGYANAQDGDYDKAVCHYDQLLALQTKQMGRNHIEISETLMKIVWVHVKLYEWEEAREKLERIKKIQVSNNADSRKLSKTDRLINEVTYQLLKYTSFSETVAVSLTSAGVRNPFTGRKLDFAFLRPPTDDMTASIGTLKKPINSSKMSGHKLNYS
jgi:tetratricopeptide (TPR) repeat protein